MRPEGRCRAYRTLAALGLLLSVAWAPLAAAQDEPHLRVEVSSSGRVILDSLLNAIASRAGVTGLVISHVQPMDALRDFCRNEAGVSPDVVLVTRRMQSALAAECLQNGANDIANVKMASDPLILAVRNGSSLTSLTSRQVYLAIAREVPLRDDFVHNTAVRWSDVDPTLPPQDIHFQLPMRDEGSRATFDALVLQAGCRDEGPVKQIFDERKRTLQCITLRSDRVREIPRAQALKTLLDAPVGTVGVLSEHELADAKDQFIALTLDVMSPTPEAIETGSYDIATSFWLYAKRNGATDPIGLAIRRIVAEAQSDEVIGPSGPLAGLGVAPLSEQERAQQRADLAAAERPYGLAGVEDWVKDTAVAAWHMFGVRPAVPATLAGTPPMDFTMLMDIAGYQITDIQSSIGIIPAASMTFGLAREMSDADQEYLRRVLRRDALLRPNAVSAFQRRIISSIMGVEEVGGFQVSKVEIDFLPLPSVSLDVQPKGSGAPQSNNSSSASE